MTAGRVTCQDGCQQTPIQTRPEVVHSDRGHGQPLLRDDNAWATTTVQQHCSGQRTLRASLDMSNASSCSRTTSRVFFSPPSSRAVLSAHRVQDALSGFPVKLKISRKPSEKSPFQVFHSAVDEHGVRCDGESCASEACRNLSRGCFDDRWGPCVSNSVRIRSIRRPTMSPERRRKRHRPDDVMGACRLLR